MPELTPEIRARRVAVARDVLERLDLNKLTVISENGFLDDSGLEEIPDVKDLRDCVDAIEAACPVCARGALLLSKARLFNAVPMSELVCKYVDGDGNDVRCMEVDRSVTRCMLADTFDPQTLRWVEAAFECFSGYDDDRDALEFARKIGVGRKNDEARIRATMANIIENDGEFLP